MRSGCDSLLSPVPNDLRLIPAQRRTKSIGGNPEGRAMNGGQMRMAASNSGGLAARRSDQVLAELEPPFRCLLGFGEMRPCPAFRLREAAHLLFDNCNEIGKIAAHRLRDARHFGVSALRSRSCGSAVLSDHSWPRNNWSATAMTVPLHV